MPPSFLVVADTMEICKEWEPGHKGHPSDYDGDADVEVHWQCKLAILEIIMEMITL